MYQTHEASMFKESVHFALYDVFLCQSEWI